MRKHPCILHGGRLRRRYHLCAIADVENPFGSAVTLDTFAGFRCTDRACCGKLPPAGPDEFITSGSPDVQDKDAAIESLGENKNDIGEGELLVLRTAKEERRRK